MVSHSPCCLFFYFFFFYFLLQLRKPLIERKRRERINTCLDQLKETVIGAFRLDVSISLTWLALSLSVNSGVWIKLTSRLLISQQQSKLEKADILEMTVKHLQNIQSSKLNGKDLDGSVYAPSVALHVLLWVNNWAEQTKVGPCWHQAAQLIISSQDVRHCLPQILYSHCV